MNNVPKTLSDEVVGAINALIHGSDRFRDWSSTEVQSLRPEIKRLQKVDARDAFVRFGALAAICGEVDLMHENFGKALQLPGELATKHEYWVSVVNAALYKEAKEIGTWLLDPKRGFFQEIWRKAVCLGQVREVWNRLEEAKRTFPELSDVDFSGLKQAASVMEQRRLTDNDIISVLDLMGEVQRAHRIMFSGIWVSNLRVIRPPEEPPYLYFTIPLAADVSEIHAMNRELIRLILEKLPDGAFPGGMVSCFAKAHAVELRAAA